MIYPLRENVANLRWLSVGLIAVFLLGSCRRSDGNHDSSHEASPSASAPSKIVLRDDTKNTIFTWVDAEGDFHPVEKIAEVPADRRERVRVVVTTRTGDPIEWVQVADLRTRRSDGTYPVALLSRAAWDDIGANRRKQRLEALAPQASPSGSSQAGAPPSEMSAVVYGAEWCGACRQTAAYLKSKGVKLLEKDVDRSPAVQAELRQKLTSAGLPPTSSIPIIDIGGRIIVGFNQAAIDQALGGTSPPKGS